MKPGGAELQLGTEAEEIAQAAEMLAGIPEKPLSARSPPDAACPDPGADSCAPFEEYLGPIDDGLDPGGEYLDPEDESCAPAGDSCAPFGKYLGPIDNGLAPGDKYLDPEDSSCAPAVDSRALFGEYLDPGADFPLPGAECLVTEILSGPVLSFPPQETEDLGMSRRLLSLGGILLATACVTAGPPAQKSAAEVKLPTAVSAAIESALAGSPGITAVSFYDLATGETAGRQEHRRFHAASTMKVPVLVELYRAIGRGELSPDRPVPIRNEFKSIVDGSPFVLIREEDGDPDLYAAVGESRPVAELARRMIQRSSNLATNLLIELLDPKRVTAEMRTLGANDIEVLRGVEDQKAFDAGLINSTTAYDLMVILRAIAEKKAVSAAASAEMIEILEGQEFKSKIPAGLPPGTRVANKTGDITGVHHDAAIVLPAGRAPYVLVVLTEGYPSEEAADASIAAVSRAVWQAVAASRRRSR